MTQALLAILFALALAGGGLKALSWYKRHRILRDIDPDAIVRDARGVSMKVLVQGTRSLPGMSTSRANRTVGDLVLLPDRFVITSSRGLIADLREGRRKFRSVRCTGPGRLIIEGDVPTSTDQHPGLYRVELVLPDANTWAEVLKPWIREGGEFGSL
jgi:hypothetical protein